MTAHCSASPPRSGSTSASCSRTRRGPSCGAPITPCSRLIGSAAGCWNARSGLCTLLRRSPATVRATRPCGRRTRPRLASGGTSSEDDRMEHDDLITRRQALSRVAILLGGAISAPTLAGALDAATRRAWTAPGPDWAPRTLDPGQLELVAVMADHIIPQTDTPGGRAAGVHRFVDALLSDHYPAPERDRFVAGLADVDAQARSRHGKAFVECTSDQQVALLTALDEAAYPTVQIDSPRPPETWFFRRMKELTLVGYYTSQVGATEELHPSPFGAYRGDIPYSSVGRAWS